MYTSVSFLLAPVDKESKKRGNFRRHAASGALAKFVESGGAPAPLKKESLCQLLDNPEAVANSVGEILVAEFSRRRTPPEDLMVRFFARRESPAASVT